MILLNNIRRYDAAANPELGFAFDYDSSGKLDHLVLYRPGTGAISILKQRAGSFSPVYRTDNGIGGYDLADRRDRAFAYDYDGTGKLDHLVFCRPGGGACSVLTHQNGTFAPVYTDRDCEEGTGGADLPVDAARASTRAPASARTMDHMVFYRPTESGGPGRADSAEHMRTPSAPGFFPLQLVLEAANVTPTSATLSWSGLVPEAAFTLILRANPDGTIFPWVVPAPRASIVDPTLADSMMYLYVARQVTRAAVGPWSFPLPVLTQWAPTYANPLPVSLSRSGTSPWSGVVFQSVVPQGAQITDVTLVEQDGVHATSGYLTYAPDSGVVQTEPIPAVSPVGTSISGFGGMHAAGNWSLTASGSGLTDTGFSLMVGWQ